MVYSGFSWFNVLFSLPYFVILFYSFELPFGILLPDEVSEFLCRRGLWMFGAILAGSHC